MAAPKIKCSACGGEMITNGIEEETLVGYYSDAGHDHNDNCLFRAYRCRQCSRVKRVALRRRCPSCNWVGKATCFCHPDPKVNAWPGEPGGPGEI